MMKKEELEKKIKALEKCKKHITDGKIDLLIAQLEVIGDRVFTEDEKKVFKMGYRHGCTDGIILGKQEMLDFLDS